MKRRVFAVVLFLTLAVILGTAVSADNAPKSGLPKLSTPIDLQWGIEYIPEYIWDDETDEEEIVFYAEEHPGYISWRMDDLCQNQFELHIYRQVPNGEDIDCMPSGLTICDEEAVDHFFHEGLARQDVGIVPEEDLALLENGTYYFTVQARGDGVNYANSDVAVSDTWRYIRPNRPLEAPTNLTWDGRTLRWDHISNRDAIAGYTTAWYYAETERDAPEFAHYFSSGIWDETKYDIDTIPWEEWEILWDEEISRSNYLDDDFIEEVGSGYYYARVRAVSYDITEYDHGEWSVLSGPIHIERTSSDIVKKAIADIEPDATPEEIRQVIRSIDPRTWRTALESDDADKEGGIAEVIAELEKDMGVTVNTEVDPAMRGDFAPGDVSIVGAAFNDLPENTDTITLSVAPLAEETDRIIPPLYKDTITTKFSMELDGVTDSKSLQVPVKITMPVPKGIDPDFLVILHYHTDGVPEVIYPHIFREKGKYYATFVLTSFSDFVMTEAAENDASTVKQGFFGNQGELAWQLRDTGELVLSAATGVAIPGTDVIYAAKWDEKGFAGVSVVDPATRTASVGSDWTDLKLLWLDEKLSPRCGAASID